MHNILQRAAEGISPVAFRSAFFYAESEAGHAGYCRRGRVSLMPQTKLQGYVYSVLMALAMVYGMELYNQVLMAGGLTNELFLAPFEDIIPLSIAVLILEHFIGGPFAQHFTFRSLDATNTPQLIVIVVRASFTCMAMCPLMSMVATLAFKQPELPNLIATWMQTVGQNFPMALLWQLFVAGPVVRFIVKRIPTTLGSAD